MENGLNCMTRLPHNMALGAGGNPSYAREKGRVIAREARSLGVHWTFSPVIDLTLDINNPETSTRAYGGRPGVVSAMAPEYIRGVQEDGLLAATAKHFPGAGADGRDQHLCTSLNPLSVDAWWESYGRCWRAAIDAGVWSVMSGHIAFPAYEGLSNDVLAAMPATLSSKLQVDLLRGELGFDGVIVSDAVPMVGITSRVREEDLAVENILAGGDVILFADPRNDFARLMAAVQSGRLSEARVRESTRRVLEMKARLGFAEADDSLTTRPDRSIRLAGEPVSGEERARHEDVDLAVAQAGITLQRGPLPAPPPAGGRVLTVTVRYEHAAARRAPALEGVDGALRDRGFDVDHLVNPSHTELIDRVDSYDLVCIDIVHTMHALMGTMRLVGKAAMIFWRGFWVGRTNVVFTSFGTPYVLYEFPHLPNMVLAYSATPGAQNTAVRLWLGEIEAPGKCPTDVPYSGPLTRATVSD